MIGLDFAGEMLRGAQTAGRARRVFVQGDGTLPAAAQRSFDQTRWYAASPCATSWRSSPVFEELARVLAPGGRVALLDVDRPTQPLLRAGFSFYFDRVVPLVGGLLSDRQAYAYLPQSTVYLPPAPELCETLSKAGFANVQHRRMLLGSAQLLTGELPA